MTHNSTSFNFNYVQYFQLMKLILNAFYEIHLHYICVYRNFELDKILQKQVKMQKQLIPTKIRR